MRSYLCLVEFVQCRFILLRENGMALCRLQIHLVVVLVFFVVHLFDNGLIVETNTAILSLRATFRKDQRQFLY